MPPITTYTEFLAFVNERFGANGNGEIAGDELAAALAGLGNLSQSNDSVADTVGRPLKDFKTLAGTWTDALISSVDSGEPAVLAPSVPITLEGNISISGDRDFELKGGGRSASRITLVGATAGFTVGTNTRGRISGISLLGTGNVATGILHAGGKFFAIENVYAEGLLYGVLVSDTAFQTVPIGPQLINVIVNGCGYGFRLTGAGEYATLLNCQAYGCTNSGAYIQAGNVKVVGGTFEENFQGIVVQGTTGIDGASGNPDHGGIIGATINHNHSAGVALIGIANSFLVTGCNIWATVGNGGVDTTYRRADHTVGLYIEDSKNVVATGNVIANNRVNIALSGVTTSRLEGLLKATPEIIPGNVFTTEFHIREYAGGTNAQNRISVTSEGTLKNGETRTYVPLTDTNSQANQVEVFSNLTPRVLTLSGAAPATYYLTGEVAHVVLKTDYTGVLHIPPVRRQLRTEITVIQVAAGQTVTAVVDSASALTSNTALATIVGTSVTFWASGNYVLTPSGSDSFAISASAIRTLGLTLSYVNSWGDLGGNRPVKFWKNAEGMLCFEGMMTGGTANSIAATLPVGYRPDASGFLGANTSEVFGAIQIDTGGNIIVKNLSPGNWVSLEGIRMRL